MAAAVLALFPAPSIGAVELFYREEITQNCDVDLDVGGRGATLITRYGETRIEPLPNDRGFSLTSTRDARLKQKLIYLKNFRRPRPNWPTDSWLLGDQAYSFINVGHANMALDAQDMNRVVLGYLQTENPKFGLDLTFGIRRRLSVRLLRSMRWALHDKVVQNYSGTYGYLSLEDFDELDIASSRSSNHDVLVVLEDQGDFDWINVDEKKWHDDVIQTLQISYFGERTFFKPNLRGVLASAQIEISEANDKLPFEERIVPSQRAALRDNFYRRFEARQTAEFARYMRFKKRPVALGSKLVLEGLALAAQRGVRYVVASTNKLTAEAFARRYGFQKYARLPTRTRMEEWVSYLDLEDSAVRLKLMKIKAEAARVTVSRSTFIYPSSE